MRASNVLRFVNFELSTTLASMSMDLENKICSSISRKIRETPGFKAL